MKDTNIINEIKRSVLNKSVVSTKEITKILMDYFPDSSPSTISWRINQLKKDNLLFQVGRGLYSFEFKPDYLPELSLKTKRIYNRVKQLHQADLIVWDTLMFSSIMGTEIEKQWIFLAVPKEEVELLFDKMLNFSKQVFIQPDKEVINRYILPQNEVIIIVPLISETPLNQNTEYITPTLEGLLVNAWIDAESLLEPMGININELFQKAFSKYNVNQSKLLRYASRRDKRKSLESLIKKLI